MLRESGCESPLVLVSFPAWTGVARLLKQGMNSRVIYDCHDLIEGFDNVPPQFAQEERALFGLSDLVLFTADWLREEKLRQLSGAELCCEMLRNAATPSDFQGVQARPDSEPTTIGYAGALSAWFDAEALESAAMAHPEWRFLLIGRPESENLMPLRRLANVEFAGELRYEELPEWFSRMDVGIIPFRRIPLTMATNPVKLYEYLASGLPVVSADLPEVARLGSLVLRYRTPGEFVLQLESAVRAGRDGRQARIDAVQGETWAARSETLHQRLLQWRDQRE
jgi:glycosyltransferase involved in cell wall biosynthesis